MCWGCSEPTRCSTPISPTSQESTDSMILIWKTSSRYLNKSSPVLRSEHFTKFSLHHQVNEFTITQSVNDAKNQPTTTGLTGVPSLLDESAPSAQLTPSEDPTLESRSLKRSSRQDSEPSYSVKKEELEFSIDFNRDFLYAVRHHPTGILIHLGRYVNPFTWNLNPMNDHIINECNGESETSK